MAACAPTAEFATAQPWQWDERRQIGTDYESPAEIAQYDRRMAELRHFDLEIRGIVSALGLRPEQSLLEIGCGTGRFARAAARQCRRVVAADVSAPMRDYAAQKAEAEGLTNLEFRDGGFLTFEPEGERFDAAVSQLALHHLPDLWKAVALERVFGWLRPGGRFYLQDVVFGWGEEGPNAYFGRLVKAMPESSRPNFCGHISGEFSTLDWVMRGLIERAGFTILASHCAEGFMAHYVCERPAGRA